MPRLSAQFLTALAILLAAALPARSQATTTFLAGRVLDENQARITGVQVRLSSKGANRERTFVTEADGSFRFDGLAPGEYQLSARARGFSVAEKRILIKSGEASSIDLTLQPSSVAETVVVSSGQLLGNGETVARTPGAVDIIDKKTLESSRVLSSSEALRKVSGVNVRDEEGFGLRPNIGIRGLNPTRSTKVLLLEDGLPLTYAPYGDNASYYHPPVDRFESIEIVKGSGQILYGPTTVGGVVNYITPAPPVNAAGFLTLMGGNRDYFNGHLNYGGTWKGTGLVFDYTRKQGELAREDQRSGLNDVNFKSVSALGMKHALILKGNYYGERSNITYSGLTEAEYQANPRQSIFRNDFFDGDRFGGSITHAYVPNDQMTLTTNLYGSVFYRDWWRQSSNSGERPNRLNTLAGGDRDCRSMADLHTTCGNQGRLRKYYVRGVESRVRANFAFLGVSNEADFGGRIHFETQDRQQQNGDTPSARRGVVVEDNERKNAAYSVFLQNRFLLRDWTITPGVRLEHIKFQRTNRLANSGAGVTGRTELTQFVPGIGVSYHPASRLTIFAGVHRGFAPPRTEDIINNATGGTVDLDSELSWNYEVGIRSLPAKGFQIDATLFRMDYENQIVPASLAGGVGTTFTNGGETLHQGFEITGRLDTGTIFNSRHNFYVRTAFTYLPTAKFTGTRFSNVGGFGNVSVSGNRLPYAPEQLLNVMVGHSHSKGVNTFLEATYIGRQFGDDLNTINPTANGQRGAIPSYTVWNATFDYEVEAVRSTFFITVKNLFDRTYIVDRSRGLLPSSPRLIQTGIKFRL